jgi:hypothetical protein
MTGLQACGRGAIITGQGSSVHEEAAVEIRIVDDILLPFSANPATGGIAQYLAHALGYRNAHGVLRVDSSAFDAFDFLDDLGGSEFDLILIEFPTLFWQAGSRLPKVFLAVDTP